MPDVTLRIGDRDHRIACREGSEDQVRRMGAMLNERFAAANKASGGLNAERTMLFIALMLADALEEAGNRPTAPAPVAPASAPPPATDDGAMARLADKLEAIAAALEKTAPSA